jgi:hypothetical protein
MQLNSYVQNVVNRTSMGRDALAPFLPKPQAVGGDILNFAPQSPDFLKPIGQVSATAGERSAAANRPFSADGAPNLPYQQYELNKARTGAARLSVDNRAEGTYAQTMSKTAAESDAEAIKNAPQMEQGLRKINETLRLINAGQPITGIAADFRTNIERVKALLPKGQDAAKVVSDSQLLDSLLGSDVFPMIQALGIGARGLDTPAEREFLKQVMTGDRALDKDTLLRMTELRKKVLEKAVATYNQRVDAGELDDAFKFSRRTKRKIELPTASIEDAVKQSGVPYEPSVYEYRLGPNGEVQRKKK